MGLFLLVAGDLVETGGMDRANYALADHLSRSGAEVHLVAHRVAEPLAGRPNVFVHSVPRPLDSHLAGAPLLDRWGRRQARRIAAQGGRVIVNGGNCLWGDVNWVHFVHAAYVPESRAGRLHSWKTRYHHRRSLNQEAASLRRARVVIANSERTRSDLIERVGLDGARIRTVYLGVDPERFRPISAAERAGIRASLGWPSGDVRVAFVGGLGDRRKGFDTVFAAWRLLLSDREPNAVLVVVGRGVELEIWKRLAAKAGMDGRIEFLGFRDDVPRVLAACDALVSPSRYESYGLVVQEALCTGIPALVSRDAGIAERYPAGLRGLLLDDPADAAELASCLKRWLGNRAGVQKRLREFSATLRRHSWDHMAGEIVECIT